jgi:tetratricopeptide (TPR) repeat protein
MSQRWVRLPACAEGSGEARRSALRARRRPSAEPLIPALVLSIVIATTACRSDRPAAEASAELPALPDLSAMADSVQRQIRAQRDDLDRLNASPTAEPAALARAHGAVGQLLMAADAAAAAAPYFTRAALLDPAEPRWPYYLGHLARMQGDVVLAAQHFERALALRPRDVATLVWLGRVLLDQGRAGEAATFFSRALEQQSDLGAAQEGLGRAALENGRFADAVEHLEAALRGDPAASALHYPLALAYRGLGRTAEAESHMRVRGEVRPGFPDPLMAEVAGLLESAVVFEGQGDRALMRGDARTAVDAFKRAAVLAPERLAIKQKLATALAVAGDLSAALELYREILEANPNFAEAHYSLGAIYLGSGQLEEAARRFAAAIKADPGYLQARLQLAHVLRRMRRPQAALVEYEGALRLDPRLAEARLGYAVSQADAARWGAARAWLQEGRRTYPDRPEFTELLVRLLAAAPDANVRDGAQAVALGRMLIEQSRSWRTLEAMAMALAESGAFAEAIARQQEAIDDHGRRMGRSNAAMTAILHRYERREPCRVPWVGDPIG